MNRSSPAVPLSLATIVRRSHEQVSCELADEVVILSLKHGSYFGLDPVAARIWELLVEPCSIPDIRDRLLDEYQGVECAQCERELLALLEQLREWGLVEIQDA